MAPGESAEPGLMLAQPLTSVQLPGTAKNCRQPGQLETSFIFVFPKTRQEKLWIMLERVKVSPFLKGQWARPDGCLMKLFWFLRPVWLGAICWVSIGQGHREAPALGAAILHQDNDGF